MVDYQCPTCRTRNSYARPEDAPFRPFCSERCKLIDLGKWLNEEYRVTEELPEQAPADEASSDGRNEPTLPPDVES